MLKRMATLLLAIVCMAGSALAEKIMYVNNPNPTDRLNLRRYPDRESLSHGKYYNGAEVTVLQTEGEWSEVIIGRGAGQARGWMMSKFLSSEKPKSVMAQHATTAPVKAYQQPSASAQTMTIAAGRRMSTIGVLEQTTRYWWHVKVYTDSSEGPYYAYINEQDLINKAVSLTPEHGVLVYVSNPDHTDRLHLREAPSESSKSLGKYYNGCIGEMIGFSEDGEWLNVRLYGRTGWMKSSFLCIEGQRNTAYYGIPSIRVTSEKAPAYTYPEIAKSNYAVTIKKGTVLDVLGLVGEDKLHVRTEDGSTCFVYAADTDFTDPKK